MKSKNSTTKLGLAIGWLVLSFSLYGQIREPVIFPFKQSNTILLKTAGGFNFDNDEFLDVVGIAAQVDGRGNIIPRSTYLVHLEESPGGDFNVQWRFNVPAGLKGDFVDVLVTDLDQNGTWEVIGALNISETETSGDPAWLYLFSWNERFSAEPLIKIGSEFGFNVRPRPVFLALGDVNNDERDEIIISSVGPERSVIVLGVNGSLASGNLKLISHSSKLKGLSGIQPFRALGVNMHANPGAEIVIVGGMQELEIAIYPFELKGAPLTSLTIAGSSRSEFDLEGMSAGDLDGDGLSELILPEKAGGAQLIRQENKILKAIPFLPKALKINCLTAFDLNNNTLSDLLLNLQGSSDIQHLEYTLTGSFTNPDVYARTAYPNPVLKNVRYLTFNMVQSSTGDPTGAIVAPFIMQNFNQHGLCYWQLVEGADLSSAGLMDTLLGPVDSALALQQPAPQATPRAISEADYLRSELVGLEGEEIGLSPLPEGEGKTATAAKGRKIIKPDILTHPGQTVQQPLNVPDLSLADTKNLNVNVETPPGMRFDLANKLFTWVPTDTALGLHKVTATLSWGGKKEVRTFTIYVNSMPKITSTIPFRDIIQIGETFRFRVEVRDENPDALITYNLLNCPAGATINPAGEILWKPTFEQTDWYDFIVEATDGYDSDKIEFALFVNHPVTIESTAPSKTSVGKNYTYEPVTADNNKGAFLGRYTAAPRIENWRQTGVMEARILDDPIRNNLGKFIERYIKTFQPTVTPATMTGVPKNLFQEVFEDSGKLVLVYNLAAARGLSAYQIVESFFKNLNMSTPRLSTPEQIYLYTFLLKDPPTGLKMDGYGKIEWIPTAEQFDYQSVAYTVSDGYFSAEEHAQVYVNYPPNITSSPDTNAYVNTLWQYELNVTDLNTDSKLSYEILKGPEGMVISPQGVITWRPTDLQLNGHSFIVRVTDGMASDTQKGRVFVNVKPKILSVPKPVALTNLKYEYQLEAEDPNGDAMTYKVIRLPKYASFDPESGLLTWNPRKVQKGVNDVVLEVVDSHGWSTMQEFQVHVFHNPATKRLSFIRDTISLLALVGVIYLVAR